MLLRHDHESTCMCCGTLQHCHKLAARTGLHAVRGPGAAAHVCHRLLRFRWAMPATSMSWLHL